MTITTVEALEELPLETVLTIGTPGSDGRTARRVEGGWDIEGFILPSSALESDIRHRNVVQGRRKEVGQVWDEGAYGYFRLIVAQVEGHSYVIMFTRNNTPGFVGFQRLTEDSIPGTLVEPRPRWATDSLRAVGHEYALLDNQRRQLSNQSRESQAELRTLRANANATRDAYMLEVQTRLHAWMAENGKVQDEGLLAVLRESGMAAPRVPRIVEASVLVWEQRRIPTDAIRDAMGLPEGAELMNDPAPRLRYKMPLTYTTEGEVGGNCVCRNFGRVQLRRMLRDRGIEYYDCGIESRTCDSPQHGENAATPPTTPTPLAV